MTSDRGLPSVTSSSRRTENEPAERESISLLSATIVSIFTFTSLKRGAACSAESAANDVLDRARLVDRARLALGFASRVAAIESQTSNPASIECREGIARSYELPLGQGR